MKSSQLLQWGHVFSDVEMKSEEELAEIEKLGFNGATSFQTWKCSSRLFQAVQN